MVKNEKDSKVKTYKFKPKKYSRINYKDENNFNKLLRSIKKYNMKAYKEIIFDIIPNLRAGNLVGIKLNDDTYKCHLYSSEINEFVYGELYLVYKIIDGRIYLWSIEPKEYLLKGHSRELPTYKGVTILTPKDRFKVDLFISINKNNGIK